MNNRPLRPGEPAPWFHTRIGNQPFAFDTAAGRYFVLCFFGSAGRPEGAEFVHRIMKAHRQRFDDINLSFIGISTDPADLRLQRISSSLPGIRFVGDFDQAISMRYGACSGASYEPITYVLDPLLRVVAALPWSSGMDTHFTALLSWLDRLPAIGPACRANMQAPVLVLPGIFEYKLCRSLIGYYAEHGGRESGFMVDVDDKTVEKKDHRFKRRRDCYIEDDALRQACMARLRDRLQPEIYKAFQFKASMVERHLVACYRADENGHFMPHRDNTTRGTAHRRFAVSLFLNSDDYDGGYLRFPEFGPAVYKAPPGGAVVFSCSLLHEATVVTRGERYMYLPFLYDDAADEVRAKNLRFLQSESSNAMERAEPASA